MPAASRRAPSTRYAWYVVAILTLANVSANVDQFVLALLVGPIKRDLGITDVQMSYLGGPAFALFYVILGLPIARIADRANRRNLIAGGVALWSVFTALGAVARTFGQLFLTRVGVGVGEASLYAPSVSLLSDYFPREKRARALSVYSLGIFLGAGASYIIGGWVVGRLAVNEVWTLPIIGAVRPWQTVFLVVGLPGVAVALALLTVREPERGHPVSPVQPPLSEFLRYVWANRRTFGTLSFAFASSALVNVAIAFWLAQFLIRTYGITASQAGRIQGLLTMSIGTFAVIAGGWLSDWFVKRGRVDGPLRVGMIGAAGMLVAATAYPLMPTLTLAVIWLAVVNAFAALPFGAAWAAASEVVPAPLRAQGVALYFFVLSLVSRTLGPSSVAWLTDYVFHDDAKIRYSLATVNVVGMCVALMLFAFGLSAYRKTVASAGIQ
ncbi:MAG: MFS transporter [bacterium]